VIDTQEKSFKEKSFKEKRHYSEIKSKTGVKAAVAKIKRACGVPEKR
jgi:uncharacterized protein YerC